MSIVNLLDYDGTSVKIWRPTATGPTTVEQENGETLETLEAGERIRAAVTPAGWRLTVCGD